ncbi:mechanosensitive ion channel family protein [Paenibacillus radicis (ex Gao et al. 2016)]|uniref:Mechanosensitive ion channel protein MscS n=1 Tax=Paenibacillus radicis (ex Gao et al. 2016) TaxID=1737354 RepID=A0A917H8J7_9BACL|nr:mechanosensitive ion channel family protein [Paenibacillus radicis (ex Gao et al. 2016)]GGG71385.1 mechanosensitive ion channel protein MscS [Paenibacillus radicis (ex Gao et al. 2016)]
MAGDGLALYESVTAWLSIDGIWGQIGESVLRIVAILIAGPIVIWIANKMIDRVILNQAAKRMPNQSRRMTTVGKLIKNVFSYVGYFITLMIILSEFGIELAPLLAGAGVIGLAIGFGAQSLVKDIIAGFFIILEDQFAVDDIIQTGQFKGKVEVVGLRTTRILSWTGEVHIIPNGMINEVTNFSVNNSVAVVDVAISYEEDVERATSIIRDAMGRLEDPNLVKEPEVLGVQQIGASNVLIRVTAECLPHTHFAVARSMNLLIKKTMDEHGIDIPYPRMVTYHRAEGGT